MPLEKIADQAQQFLMEFQQTYQQEVAEKNYLETTWSWHLENKFWWLYFWRFGSSGHWHCGPKFLWYYCGCLIWDNSLSILSIGIGNCCSSKGSPLPQRTQSTWFYFRRWFKILDFGNQKSMFSSPKRGSHNKGHYVLSWFPSIFLFLSYTTTRQCSGTCPSSESEILFSYFNLEGVCSSWHLQGVCFVFPSNKITVLLFGRFLKKKNSKFISFCFVLGIVKSTPFLFLSF